MSETRFAVLHHTGVAEPHYDLMVETTAGSPLATWRVAAWPVVGPMRAERLADHRAVYLDYDGPVSGGRGRVDRVAGGGCDVRVDPAGRWTITTAVSAILLRLTPGDGWVIEPVTGMAASAVIDGG